MPIELGSFSLGVIAGGIVVTWVSHVLSKSRDKESRTIIEFNKAISELRAAFAPAIVKFKLISDANAIDQMLREELIPQAIAIEKFRPFVSPNKKEAYQEAWEEYHQSHKREGNTSVYFLDYAMGDERERFRLFNSRIDKIPSFTEQ